MHSQTEPIWVQTVELEDLAPLRENISTEVCIIGAGIAGLSAAYHLIQDGKSVVVLDQGSVSGGETSRTTAHLTNALDDRYFNLEKYFGIDGAKLAAESHTAAINRVEAICQQEGIDCDFERLNGYLFSPPNASLDILKDELKALQRVGLAGAAFLPRAPLSSFDTGPCIQFPNQAQIHPLKYMKGLKEAVLRLGGRIFTRTYVNSFKGGKMAHVTTEEGFTVTAQALIVATNTPVNDRFTIHTKQAAYRSYVIAALMPKGSLDHALYWDTEDPYHYVRLQKGGEGAADDFIIIGGEDHKTGQAPSVATLPYSHLELWARERFPMMKETTARWSGQVMEPADSLAFIGRNPGDEENVYIATGDSGNGMTHGTIAGILLTDLILKRDNPWERIYNPSRKPYKALVEFGRENLNVAAQFSDWVKGGDVEDEEEIPIGSGAVIRKGMSKIAVFRDSSGECRHMSAVCPHLGCIVEWNDGEKSWDCPCHGSRFAAHGEVLNGPAVTPLKRVEKESVAGHSPQGDAPRR